MKTTAPSKPTKASKAFFKIYQHYASLIALFGNPDCAPDVGELRTTLNSLENVAQKARALYEYGARGSLKFEGGDSWPVDFFSPAKLWNGVNEKTRIVNDLFKPSVAAALGWDDYDLIPEQPLLSLDWNALEDDDPHLVFSCVFHRKQQPQYRRLVEDEYGCVVLAPRMISLQL
jgi:hypothetical protein